MPFIEYGDLFRVVENGRFLSESRLSCIVGQLLAIISSLQEQHFYHLDLKPENILINKDLVVFICDFGSCLKIRHAHDIEAW